MIRLRIAIFVSLFLVLSGCDESTVARDLDQNQVNEIVALLGSSGLTPNISKDHGPRGKYSVQIPESQFLKAVELLNSAKLPSETGPGLSELLSAKGILPASRAVEDMRLDYALGLELKELLEGSPGVKRASFVVRHRSVRDNELKGVIATIVKSPESKLTVDEVTELIMRTVGSVEKDRIHVTLTGASTGVSAADNGKTGNLVPFLGMWKVPDSEYSSLALVLLTLLIFVGVAALMVGFYAGRRAVIREVFASENVHAQQQNGHERIED